MSKYILLFFETLLKCEINRFSEYSTTRYKHADLHGDSIYENNTRLEAGTSISHFRTSILMSFSPETEKKLSNCTRDSLLLREVVHMYIYLQLSSCRDSAFYHYIPYPHSTYYTQHITLNFHSRLFSISHLSFHLTASP